MSEDVASLQNTSLDELGILAGTDKSSLEHDYLRHYERCLAPLRSARFNLIEIGVLGGRSVRMWKKFFPNATIVGLDILPQLRRFAEERIHIEIGSQDDPEFLARVCDQFPPTIVVDDGSHIAEHILTTFKHVFPRLLPGGWYIIEDLPHEPYDLLTATARSVGTGRGDLAEDVEQVLFVRNAAFLRKADSAERLAELDRTVQLAEQTGEPDSLMFLAIRMSRYLNMPERAEVMIRKALAANPVRPDYHWWLSQIRAQRKDFPEALTAVDTAIALYREQQGNVAPHYDAFRDRLRQHLGQDRT